MMLEHSVQTNDADIVNGKRVANPLGLGEAVRDAPGAEHLKRMKDNNAPLE